MSTVPSQSPLSSHPFIDPFSASLRTQTQCLSTVVPPITNVPTTSAEQCALAVDLGTFSQPPGAIVPEVLLDSPPASESHEWSMSSPVRRITDLTSQLSTTHTSPTATMSTPSDGRYGDFDDDSEEDSGTETPESAMSPSLCPDSPPLDPIADNDVVNSNYNINVVSPTATPRRLMRPSTLPLGEMSWAATQEGGAPITPLTLSPGPVSGISFEGYSMSYPVVPPPTPMSAIAFGSQSPLLDTSPAISRRGSEIMYARRGSTGTFGGARSHASVIIVPATASPTGEFGTVTEGSVHSHSSHDPYLSPTTDQFSFSPTHKSHEQPESPRAIMQHLLEARERNELSIMPSELDDEQPRASEAETLRKLTSLYRSTSREGVVEEQQPTKGLLPPETADNDETETSSTSTRYWRNRHTAMVDLDESQVRIVTHLRERTGSEAGRVLDGLCDQELPPNPLVETLSSTAEAPLAPEQSVYRVESGSSVSGCSIRPPSATGSTSSSSSRQKNRSTGGRSTSNSTSSSSRFNFSSPLAKRAPSVTESVVGDLSTDPKVVLTKRTRKIEQMRGSALSEAEIERFVVEPSAPEWQRDDSSGKKASESTLSRFARTILGDPAPTQNRSDIRVVVSRESYVTESGSKPPGREKKLQPKLRNPSSSPAVSLAGTDEAATIGRRSRYGHLSKIQRMLGNHNDSDARSIASNDDFDPNGRLSAVPSLSRTTSNTSSVATERSRWTNKFRQPSSSRVASPVPPYVAPPLLRHDEAVFELSREQLSAPQRLQAQKTANTLIKKYGDAPPPKFILPTALDSPAGDNASLGTSVGSDMSEAQPKVSSSFEMYRNSLSALVHMVDHDREGLAMIVDLESDDEYPSSGLGLTVYPSSGHPFATASPRSRSPVTGAPAANADKASRRVSSPTSGLTEERPHPLIPVASAQAIPTTTPGVSANLVSRRRPEKLAHFFGESCSNFAEMTTRPPTTMADDDMEEIMSPLPDGCGGHRRGVSGHGSGEWRDIPASPGSAFPGRSHEPIVHNAASAPSTPEFHPLPPPPPPRRRSPSTMPAPASTLSSRSSSSPVPSEPVTIPPPTRSSSITTSSSLSYSLSPQYGHSPAVDLAVPRAAPVRRPSTRTMDRAMFEAVLDEISHNITSEVVRGSVGSHEAVALGKLIVDLREKRTSISCGEV